MEGGARVNLSKQRDSERESSFISCVHVPHRGNECRPLDIDTENRMIIGIGL